MCRNPQTRGHKAMRRFIIPAVSAVVLIIIYICRNQWTTSPNGGGKEDHTDPDAPKVIASTEIVEFHCRFSTLTSVNSENLKRGIYELDAVLEQDIVLCNLKMSIPGETGETVEFKADPCFMEALQELAEKFDLAGYNGLSVRVSGLPHFYGASLQVNYASGEAVWAYHNQNCFLTMEEMEAMEALFREQAGKSEQNSETGADMDTDVEVMVEDGYLEDSTDTGAPKMIESTEITSFECCFSTAPFEEDIHLEYDFYQFSAVLKGDTVSASVYASSRYGDELQETFETDTSFMEEMQAIVSQYNLAAHNGHYVVVQGLPDMYGAELDVEYVSGESISAYDNESSFLSIDAMEEIEALFGSRLESVDKN